jgi:probable phosphoglycerate mutase
MSGELVILRHGQTAWSLNGKHTGRTDVPLNDTGRSQALVAGERLREQYPDGFDLVVSSPLSRASITADLAGYSDHAINDDLMEWDYGLAEGLTTKNMLLNDPDWTIWNGAPQSITENWVPRPHMDTVGDSEILVNTTHGESLQEVADRASRVLNDDTITSILNQGGRVLLVSHSHFLRILTTVWIGAEPIIAKGLDLGTARYAVLGSHHDDHVIKGWGL